MRGTKAKQLRNIVYGDHSIRGRNYKPVKSGSITKPWTFTIIADQRRAMYQRAKKLYKRLRRTNE